MNLNPKRLENETYDAFKARRKANNKLIKAYLKGRTVEYTRKEIRKLEYVKAFMKAGPVKYTWEKPTLKLE